MLNARFLLLSNLGIDKSEENASSFSVFPTPSNGKFSISLNKDKINNIEIYNLMGEKVFFKEGVTGQKIEDIDL